MLNATLKQKIDTWSNEAARLASFECVQDDAHKARGAGIYRNVCDICSFRKRPHPSLGGWQEVTYRTLSAKLDDYTEDEETSIRFLFWLALYWDTLYELRQVPKDFHVKLFRVPEVYGKFLCDVPDVVFVGTLHEGPIRNPDFDGSDTRGYKATYTESAYNKAGTVPFWSHEVYDKFKDRLQWTYGLEDDVGCDAWDGCDPWQDVAANLLDADELKRRTEESKDKFRKKLLDQIGD